MIPYLEQPPCLVSFSGGRDSSTLLAVATAVARREGLEPPIPITQRFPDAAEAEESDSQEIIVRHLRLSDWVRREATDEFDFIGPLAIECLLRHGVLHGATSYFFLPMLREARGGTLVTGVGGDEVLRTWRWARTTSVLARRVRPEPKDALRLAAALAPARVRAFALRRIAPLDLYWLRPDAAEAVRRSFYSHFAAEPFRWDKRMNWIARQRELVHATQCLDLLAEGSGASVAQPFLAPRFLAALAHAGGSRGFGDLENVLRTHFGALLPIELIARRDKARFDEVFWGPYSREFVRKWAGEPAPIEFVDERRLFAAWLEAATPTPAATVLQALWLAAHRTSEGQPPGLRGVDPSALHG